jgi:hypothetical protein
MVVSYLVHDKPRRLMEATDCFLALRLSYVVDRLDFETFGLPELSKERHYKLLHRAINQAKKAASATVLELGLVTGEGTSSMWHPRPNSVKHFLWTPKRFGTFSYCGDRKRKAEEENNNLDILAPTCVKRFKFEADNPADRLTYVAVFHREIY